MKDTEQESVSKVERKNNNLFKNSLFLSLLSYATFAWWYPIFFLITFVSRDSWSDVLYLLDPIILFPVHFLACFLVIAMIGNIRNVHWLGSLWILFALHLVYIFEQIAYLEILNNHGISYLKRNNIEPEASHYMIYTVLWYIYFLLLTTITIIKLVTARFLKNIYLSK